MFKNILIVYGLLCIGSLCLTRSEEFAEDEMSVAQQRCRNYTQQADGLNCARNAFMALLGYRNSYNPIVWNGYSGVVISDRYILTSGYATRYDLHVVTHVALGVKDGISFDEYYRRHEIPLIIYHPKYEYGYRQANYNLALLWTNAPIQFNARVQPACLPSLGSLEVQQHALLTTYRQGHARLGHVHSVPRQQYSDKKCAESDSRYNATIHMCFGHRPALVESTQVNLGDPAVVRNNGSACLSTVVGIMSYETDPQKPLGYNRVSHFVNWIESVVWPGETRGH